MSKIRNKRQERAERNRKRLLSAAMRVFSHRGYHKATVDEICKRANLGKGTVYQHFRSKKELFLALADSRVTELGRCIAMAVEDIKDDLERVKAAISAYIGFFAAHRSFYRFLTHEQSSFGEEIRKRFHSKRFPSLNVLEEVFRSAMKSGKMKKMDPRGVAFALVGMCHMTVYRWLMSDKPYPLEREIPMITEILLRGISGETRKGA